MKRYFILVGIIVAVVSLNFKMVNLEKRGALSWNSLSYDFGQIEKDNPVTAQFSFENTGDQSLMIINVKGSCGCTVADYTKGEIRPGELGEVTATYNAAKVGAFNKTVTVTASAGDEPIVLTIKGEVVE